MDFSIYLNQRVLIVLVTGFSYVGKVIDVDKDSIVFIDKTNSRVCLKNDSIQLIKEYPK